ncbi:hypothetical protein FPQ18DRAFT_400679 [Pyronema domesticum]|uniref:Similar to Mediator of DNA damage checkpoint protein 1 acc. no. Q767L8 n=1 Tax=Pyronema omphalodes (strain CBS 100304) TaxID=1076935 RepID=U4LDC8_PYROM|nr:hypothetical protein FPQ18DRAFT_400679 [Pyronema domesticum]CCX29537.1 Similar to Mediator of DNA damage checkpoint protein 1; acc. no. Q767L8 [Pyronema omphalodes CBS 100304]
MKNTKRKTRSNPIATPNVEEQKAPELNPVIFHARTNTRIELGKPPTKDPEEWSLQPRSMEFLLQKFELEISKIVSDSLATLKYFPDGAIYLGQARREGYSIWILSPRADGTIIRTQLRQTDVTKYGTNHYYIILYQDCTIEFRKAPTPGHNETEEIEILQFMYNAPPQTSEMENPPKLQVEHSTFNPTPSNHYGGPDIIESTPLEEAKVLETPSVRNRHIDPNSSQRPRPKSPLAARNEKKNAIAPVDNDDITDDDNEEAEIETEPFIPAINNDDIIEDGSEAIETETAPIAEPEQVDELMADMDDIEMPEEQNPRPREDTRDDIFGPPLSLPSSPAEPTLRNPAIPSSSIINRNVSDKDDNEKATRNASPSDDDETNDEESSIKNADSENPIPDSLPEAFHHESMVKGANSGHITTYSKKQGPHTIVHLDEVAEEDEETPKKAGTKKAVLNQAEPNTTNFRKRKGSDAPIAPTSKKRKDQSGPLVDVMEEGDEEEVMKPPPRLLRSAGGKKAAKVDVRPATTTRKRKGKDASPPSVEAAEEEEEEEEVPKPTAVNKRAKKGIKADAVIPSSDGEEEYEFTTAPSTIEPSDVPDEDMDATPAKKPTRAATKTSMKATKTAKKAAEEKEDTQWSIPDDTQALISTPKASAKSSTKTTKTPLTRKPRTGITGTTPSSVPKTSEPTETTLKATPPTTSQASTRSTRSTPKGPTKATKSTSKTPSKPTRGKSISPSSPAYTLCFSSTPLSTSKPLLSFLKKHSLPTCSSVSNATHLVVGAPKRTPKFTLALLLGIPIISDTWLSSSLSAGNLLEPEDFYCQAPADWGVDLKSVWERGGADKEEGGMGNKVLEGCKVYLTADLQTWLKEQGNQEVVMEMLKAAGGGVVKRVPKGSPAEGSSQEVVLGKEEGDGEVKGLGERGWTVYKLGAVGWAVLQGKWLEGQEEWEAKAEEDDSKGKGKGRGRGKK